MRILVCGGRKFGLIQAKSIREDIPSSIPEHTSDWDNVYHELYSKRTKECKFILSELDKLNTSYKDFELISGMADGVDWVSVEWAINRKIKFYEYPADWKKYGKSAGFVRNKKMLDEGRPDLVVAFPGGRGTQMMVKLAKDAGVKVVEYKYEDN